MPGPENLPITPGGADRTNQTELNHSPSLQLDGSKLVQINTGPKNDESQRTMDYLKWHLL